MQAEARLADALTRLADLAERKDQEQAEREREFELQRAEDEGHLRGLRESERSSGRPDRTVVAILFFVFCGVVIGAAVRASFEARVDVHGDD